MDDFREAVVTSIDAGLPVLAYAKRWDMGFVYGYEAEGRRILVRDYHAGDAETVMPIGETTHLFCFFQEKTIMPTRVESIRAGIKQAIATASRPPDRTRRFDRDGAYYHGNEAYAIWIDRLANAESLAPEQQRQLFFVSWWVMFILADARQQAASYLADCVHQVPEAAETLRDAAAVYREIAALSNSANNAPDCFFSPHGENKFDLWTPESRRREIAFLQQLRSLEQRGIAALQRASSE
jgi:hypothetical protein